VTVRLQRRAGRDLAATLSYMPATMAAPILAYEDLGLVQGSGWLFRHLDLHLMPRDRLALIGRNGAGKSTLLRLIADTIEAAARSCPAPASCCWSRSRAWSGSSA
jgi:ABC-type molybdenum transport system ATPase subunit/photorepair protein PhrA